MANIYSKNSSYGADKTLVLGAREALVYPMPFEDWNVIKIGFFCSFVREGTDNTPLESLKNYIVNPIVGARDRMFFGIKKNTKNFPGENGEPFLGLLSNGTVSQICCDSNGNIAIGSGASNNTFFNSASCLENGGIDSGEWPRAFYITGGQPQFPNEYAGFVGLTFTVINKGTANQKVNIKLAFSRPWSDTRNSSLKSCITGSVYSDLGDVAFAYSGVPCGLPDSIFIYLPFGGVSFRIHNVAALKIS